MEEQERPKSKSSRPKKFKMSLKLDETTAINDTWLKCNDRKATESQLCPIHCDHCGKELERWKPCPDCEEKYED